VTTLRQQPTDAVARPHAGRATAARAPFRPQMVAAILARDVARYFTNAAGYVFLVLFVVACSVAAFWQPEFFANNLANLDQLNRWMPYLLLLFIPAVTMSVWAEERRQGTDELLLTLPARDVEVVLGKYLAALGIYTAALGFLAFGLTMILWRMPLLPTGLGQPDFGILLANLVGYWLMGAMFIAIGMVASMLSSNVTVAFILGALFCAVPIFTELLGSLFGGQVGRAIEDLSAPSQFRDFARGVVSASGVLYFVALAAGMLYLNMVLLGRRHWAGGQESGRRWAHALARVVAVVVALVSLVALVSRAGWRADTSAAGLSTLSAESKRLIREIPADRPVYVNAYFSPDVPREMVTTRANLVNLLRAAAAQGGDKIRLNLVEADRYSEAARDAEKRFGITPRRVFTTDEARQSTTDVILGVAFTSGLEEVVVPFFDPGLPVEYELARSIRVVSGAKRKKVGILSTDANLLGGFDFRAMDQQTEWQIVTELKKQYEVEAVSPDADIPAGFDALIVAQPSSLTQPQIDRLTAYVRNGGPTLLMVDPLPLFDRTMALSPNVPKEAPGGMFGGAPPPEPKGDLAPLLDLLGLDWPSSQIVWNRYTPHPSRPDFPAEFVFITPNSGADDAFNPSDPITSGLQEVVLLFPGQVRARGGDGPEFTPLLRTNDVGGTIAWDAIVQRNFLGASVDPDRSPHFPSGEAYTLAARIQGKPAAAPPPPTDPAKKAETTPPSNAAVDAIVVADIDMISDVFFSLRRQGDEEYNFDNVTFVLNCVDSLVGDDSFLALRKQRREHRTLMALEAQEQVFEAQRLAEEKEAEEDAKAKLAAAQERLDKKVEQVRADKAMDPRTKEIMLANLQDVENRRLEVQKAGIESQKRLRIEESKAAKERKNRSIQGGVRLKAILLPALPVLLLGTGVFLVRSGRENRGAAPGRLAGGRNGRPDPGSPVPKMPSSPAPAPSRPAPTPAPPSSPQSKAKPNPQQQHKKPKGKGRR